MPLPPGIHIAHVSNEWLKDRASFHRNLANAKTGYFHQSRDVESQLKHFVETQMTLAEIHEELYERRELAKERNEV